MKEMAAIVARLADQSVGQTVLATLVSARGSSYRRPGARLLLLPDGQRIGSISGGCLEEDVIARARTVLYTGQIEAVIYDTTSENDLVWGVGLGCHGVVRVLIERLPAQPAWARAVTVNAQRRRPTSLTVVHHGNDPATWGTRLSAPGDCPDPDAVFLEEVPPPTALVIFGAGDDAQPLARLASEFGWQVNVADPRAAFAHRDRFPTAHACVVAPADQLAASVPLDAGTLAVVMTHHYVHDVPLLRELLGRPLGYLGLLGPRKRADRILSDIESAGRPVTPDERARLHAPVGLDLGADSPEQVALSIIAEMQATLAGRDGRPLRDRLQPIHA